MTWRERFDRTYQVRNPRGTLCFIKTDSTDIANEVAQMGRLRAVWVWSNVTFQYELKENACSANHPSNL